MWHTCLSFLIVLFCTFGALALPASAQLQFTITDLGADVIPTNLTAGGHPVGQRRDADGLQAAILDGPHAQILKPAGTRESLVSAILSNVAVGYTISGAGPVGRGLRWDPVNGFGMLQPFQPDHRFTWIKGIARAGLPAERTIAISAVGLPPYTPLWCDNISTCHALATLGPGRHAEPMAINHPLDIVGQCATATDKRHACWWPLSTTYAIDDLHPPGTTWDFSSAWDINSAQDVVISALTGTTGTSYVRHATGVYDELPPLPGHAVSVVYGLNDQGNKVGHSTLPMMFPPPNSLHRLPRIPTVATLWQSDNVPVSLLTLCTNCAGWTTLERAFKINNDNMIVGYGTMADKQHAYLLTPVPAVCGACAQQPAPASEPTSTPEPKPEPKPDSKKLAPRKR